MAHEATATNGLDDSLWVARKGKWSWTINMSKPLVIAQAMIKASKCAPVIIGSIIVRGAV